MSVHLALIAGETLAAVGDRIRALCPIAGPTATDRECRVRRELVDQALEALGIVAGPRLWHSAQLDDGHVVGIWATSVEEAEIELTVWWEGHCYWVIPDADCRVRDEYFPRGKRSGRDADRRFPLSAPRRPRDRFAPTQTLFDLSGGEMSGELHV